MNSIRSTPGRQPSASEEPSSGAGREAVPSSDFIFAIINSMVEGVCVLDENGEIVYANEAAGQIFGRPASALNGRSLFDYWIAGEAEVETESEEMLETEIVEKRILRVLTTYQVLREKKGRIRDEDGRLHHITYTATPALLRQEPSHIVFLFRDVTRERATRRALQRSEERFQTIFEAAGMGILLLNLDGQILRANPAWEALCGRPARVLRGELLAELVHPDDRPLLTGPLAELAGGEREEFNHEIRFLPDGPAGSEPLWIQASISRLEDGRGHPRRLLALLENITQRKEAEAELVEVKQQLGRSREDERIHLAQELHDGPIQDLYAARYQLQALKGQDKEPQQVALVDNAIDQFQRVTDRLREICNNLRPPALTAFGFEKGLRSLAERYQALYPELAITLDLDPDALQLPETTRLTLFRIAQEMLSNVAKHAAADHVLVRFKLHERTIILEIQDDGRGFEVPARWVELSRQGHLGLLGASERAEEIDGRLLIFSTPGQGTIVRVTAPRPVHKGVK